MAIVYWGLGCIGYWFIGNIWVYFLAVNNREDKDDWTFTVLLWPVLLIIFLFACLVDELLNIGNILEIVFHPIGLFFSKKFNSRNHKQLFRAHARGN